MTNQFTYSILQYKHSLIFGESVNIGILFSFPSEDKVQFVFGDTKRIKCLYSDFDISIVNQITRNIKSKIGEIREQRNSLFSFDRTFKDGINSLLIEDSSSLQFSSPFVAVSVHDNTQEIIEEFSKILLPTATEEKKEDNKHNESYIIKRYTDVLSRKIKNSKLEHRLRKDYTIKTNNVTLNFDIGWKNETLLHLVKPISFDLKEEDHIQDKSVRFWGYFGLLNDYARLNSLHFDLLVAKPQQPSLYRAYENALDVLLDAKAPKKVITEDKIEEYSEETLRNIDKELL